MALRELRVFIVLFSEAAEAKGTTVGLGVAADAGVAAVVLSLDGTVVAAVSILIEAELTCISTLVLTSEAAEDATAAAAWAASAALTSVAVILTSAEVV